MFRFTQESIMQLWYSDTNSPVQVGDVVHLTFDLDPIYRVKRMGRVPAYVVTHVPEDNQYGKRGLELKSMDEMGCFRDNCNPALIGAYWK